MTRTTGDGTRSGADRIRMTNDTLAITILPMAGGNISAITDLRTGRNWLWQNPHIPISDHREGSDYGRDLDSGGWDEILFSISPDQIRIPNEGTRAIEDHGDLVRQQWAAERIRDQFGNDSCVMSVSGKTLAYDFSRVITLHRQLPRLTITYALNNREQFSWPWYWSAHVLLDALPDMQIDVPTGHPFRVNGESQSRQWPFLDSDSGETIDLSNCFTMNENSQEFSSKVFARAPQSGFVYVNVPHLNERLKMSFDPAIVPWLGMWFNNRGWSGCGSAPYKNLGIEPSTAPCDSVSAAVENNEIAWLGPGETRQWSVSVELSA